MSEQLTDTNEEWTLIIEPRSSLWDLKLAELWRYRDLVFLFVKRDFVSLYKQTILGPLWFIIQPLLTTLIFIIFFDKIAGIPTGGVPSVLFYLSGLVIWNYFSSCLTITASSFSTNAQLFGKVYFPRLAVPLSKVLSGLLTFGIQFVILLVFIAYYVFFENLQLNFNGYALLLPLLLVLTAGLALGGGIIISALTTKYRDLVFLLTFGVQLLMYATPVIYPLSFVSEKYRWLVLANPLTPLIEYFRFALLGIGEFNMLYLGYSILSTVIVLIAGIMVFNKVERNFIDVI
ncbi:MAG TPA: ABC transporter permease [Flavisolibacter sp.]|nr:ABC transporter permease [Flavisolibacter sp.]